MRTRADLTHLLADIDGRGYSSYKELLGGFELEEFDLHVDHVQVDPYAPPSKVCIGLPREVAGIPDALLDSCLGRIAVGDFLTRAFARALQSATRPSAGRDTHARRGGASGPADSPVSIGRPGQEVLERTSMRITDTFIEARLEVRLPAAGRRVKGREARGILVDLLPRVARASMTGERLDLEELRRHVDLLVDQEALRARLDEVGLVAFVGNGAILPRKSGDSDLPLTAGAVTFESPASLEVSFDLPSGRRVTGMGVPRGVTVIVGGGYHGKSTLLGALKRGVYPHVSGDGREWVVTVPDAASIRAEDGRAVTAVDISPFIGPLPSGTDTRRFSTTNASGSTSEAANLVEALESGATALLIDEDTSATNFMIRDERMRRLIPGDREPITPFVDRVRPLFAERGVSTVLVVGGSSAFLDVADHVLGLDSYVTQDLTERARELVAETAGGDSGSDPTTPGPVTTGDVASHAESGEAAGFDASADPVGGAPGSADASAPGEARSAVFARVHARRIRPRSLDPHSKTKAARSKGRGEIQFGRESIDLAALDQLVDQAQTSAIALVLDRLAVITREKPDVEAAIRTVLDEIDRDGLDCLSPRRGHPGNLARPRAHEIHAALNRYRGLEVEVGE